MIKKLTLVFQMTIFCIGILGLFIFPAVAEEVIKVGIPIPYTGSYASDGDDMLKGVLMAVEEINASGGLLGKKIKTVIGDTGELEPDKIVTAIEKLISRDKVDALFTGYADTGADVSTAGKYDMPFFHADTTHISTDMVRENLEDYWNIFMMDGDEGLYAPFAYKMMTQNPDIKLKNKKVAIITSDYLYNQWITEDFKKLATADGWKIVVDDVVPFGHTEWGTTLGKIRSKNPSFIFFSNMIPMEEASFIRQFVENPIDAHVYMQYGPAIPEFLELAGEAGNGVTWAVTVAALYHEDKARQWAEKFEKKYGRFPGYSTSAVCYDEVMLWSKAVKKVGSEKNYRAICEEIVKNPYTGLCGTYVFDPTDQHAISAADKIPMHFYQVVNGKQTLLNLSDKVYGHYTKPPWIK